MYFFGGVFVNKLLISFVFICIDVLWWKIILIVCTICLIWVIKAISMARRNVLTKILLINTKQHTWQICNFYYYTV